MFQTKKFNVDFRTWLNQQWLEHKEEVLRETGSPCDYDLSKYFHTYRWWLKRLYKDSHGR